MSTTTQKENLFSKLNIEQQRGEFLRKLTRDTYVKFAENESNDSDVVDIINKLRESCTNASEDILVCFLVGAAHAHLLTHMKQNVFAEIIKNILKD